MVVQNVQASIWERVFVSRDPKMSPDAANYLLRLGFDSADHARMAYLGGRANEGTLTSAEKLELDEYLQIADVLTILHSKARVALRGLDNGDGHG